MNNACIRLGFLLRQSENNSSGLQESVVIDVQSDKDEDDNESVTVVLYL